MLRRKHQTPSNSTQSILTEARDTQDEIIANLDRISDPTEREHTRALSITTLLLFTRVSELYQLMNSLDVDTVEQEEAKWSGKMAEHKQEAHRARALRAAKELHTVRCALREHRQALVEVNYHLEEVRRRLSEQLELTRQASRLFLAQQYSQTVTDVEAMIASVQTAIKPIEETREAAARENPVRQVLHSLRALCKRALETNRAILEWIPTVDLSKQKPGFAPE